MIDFTTMSVNKSVKDKGSDDNVENMDSKGNELELNPVDNIIDYLTSQKNINFKSQQIGEEELTKTDKINIANQIYSKSAFLFLTKFGSYLTQDHLDFFENKFIGDYEINFILTQYKNLLIDKNRKIVTKNRRFEALQRMLNNNTNYFSETEMMKRNPLLYEQLVGRFLSEKEKITRDNIDTKNITLLNVLMEGMDKQITKDTLEKQRCEEKCQMEESEEEVDDGVEEATYSQWGEFSESKPTSFVKKNTNDEPMITATERSLLREEFVQEMYRSFLAGEDEQVDYSEIDNNTEYDSVEVRGRDEEEKYFDSETPEETMDQTSQTENSKVADDKGNESEDELDVYMRHLNNHPSLRHMQIEPS